AGSARRSSRRGLAARRRARPCTCAWLCVLPRSRSSAETHRMPSGRRRSWLRRRAKGRGERCSGRRRGDASWAFLLGLGRARHSDAKPAIAEFLRSIAIAIALGAIGFLVVLTQSRTGLVVYLAVVGMYFERRVGAWAIVAACFIGPPMLLFGGRSGAEAE